MVITRTLSCSSSFGQFRFANHVAVSLPLSLSRFRCLSPGEGVDLTSPWELAQPMGNQRERGVSNSQAAAADNACTRNEMSFPSFPSVSPRGFLLGESCWPFQLQLHIHSLAPLWMLAEYPIDSRHLSLHSAQRFHLLISLIKAAPTILPIDCRGELNWSNDEANSTVCVCVWRSEHKYYRYNA